jgi:hypothetical protein
MTAPELSETERARLDAIEAAEPAPESLRERVARAIWEAENPAFPSVFTKTQVDQLWAHNIHDHYLTIADAALAVVKGDPS